MTTATRENVPTPRPGPTAPRSYHFPSFTRTTLPNGMRLVVAPVTKLPLVSISAVIDAGARTEREGEEGVAALTAQLLLEGAAGMDGAALTDRFERIGTSVEAHADWDSAAVTLTVMRERLPEALTLVRDLLRAPEFPEREVARLKDERLAELMQLRAEPGSLADEQFSRAVYAPTARYATPAAGSSTSVRALTRDVVRDFYARRYRASTITLVLAGDVTVDGARVLAEQLFGDWEGGEVPTNERAIDTAPEQKLIRIVAKSDAPQSEVRVGHAGLPRRTPDYFAVTVMNAVLGGLFSSRINLNLREAHGYTYGAFSAFEWRRGAGPFEVSTAVASEVTTAAAAEVLAEIDRIRDHDIAADELSLATSYLDGVFPIRYETTGAIAHALASLVTFGLGDDYYDSYRDRIRAVSLGDVRRVAVERLRPDRLQLVVVGDPALVRAPLEAMGVGPITVYDAEGREAE